ncbi:MFS transporter [Sinomonas albida]|uniref:MFS transporter n=1 Tax=Sinomonas albida TaxID=369942 RepID=UPI0010A7DBE7|nr:MFS transporter [Sinomonas albida]
MTTASAAPQKTPVRAALASWVGSALEYYDFFIYGTAAALVFNKIFFPNAAPGVDILLSMATFGVGYVARPIGAFFMGHWGDKFGRKNVLIGTVLLMGISTFLVGCLPTYAQIGVWAPVLLVALRLLQGFSASGEQSGGTSMSLEHSPENRRGFFTSFTLAGTQFGQVLAAAVFIPVSALPNDQLLTWGWRVPFWISALVVIAGLIIRARLTETPVFKEEAASNEVAKTPLAILFRHHWKAVIRVALCALVSTVSTIYGVYALAFATSTVHLDKGIMLWVGVTTNLLSLVTIPLWALLADRIGRKPVFIIGVLGSGAAMFLYMPAIVSGNYAAIFGVAILMSGILYMAENGIFPAFFSEMFPTKVRLSGMAIGTQVGFAIAGFAPTITAAIAGKGADGWVPVAWFTIIACLIAAGAALTAKETAHKTLAQIDDEAEALHAASAAPKVAAAR